MDGVESKEKSGDNSEYPKLKVMISSPENDNEESVFEDSEYASESFYTQHSNTTTIVEEVALNSESPKNNNEEDIDSSIPLNEVNIKPNNEALQHGIGCGSFNRIKVEPNDASQLGLASLVSSPTSNNSPATQHPNPTAIDTKAPIESVKDAVSKFGGIVDWKAHKEQTVERRKFIEIELEKAQEDIPMFKKECEAAEAEKTQILKNLGITNTVIEDMKLKLEREQIEEQQAKQDSDYAKLKVEELEKGIDNEATISAKAQLEVAKARHLAAVAELKIVRDELEKLQLEFTILASDRDAAIKKAEEDIAKLKELERKIEDLTIEIANIKGSLASAHAEHLEREEVRVEKAIAIDQELVNLEKELKEAEYDLERIKKETSPARDLKDKLDAASAFIERLKGELATYYITKQESNQANDVGLYSNDKLENIGNRSHNDILAAIASAKNELEQVEAHKELRKAMEEANQEKVLASSMESRLVATQKEIEDTKYFEKYALTSINNEDSSNGAILYLEEYLELKQQAHEANESETNSQRTLNEINIEIIERKKTLQIALQKAEIAKEGKLKVEQQWRNMRAEHEQRRKAAAGESVPVVEDFKSPQYEAASHRQRSPITTQAPTPAQTHTQSEIEANYKEILSLEASMAKKKKKSLFPKFWMFMGKKKASS